MKTRTKQQPFLMRAAGTLLLAVLLTILGTQTARADAVNLSVDNDFAEGTAGHYYVNMPTGDGNVLTISDSDIAGGKGTFKFYDNGGKGGNYSDGFNGYLVITAPEGYKINLAGSIAINSYDEFGVWEGSDTNNFGTELLYFSPYYTPFAPEYSPINITSGGNSFFIWFSPNGSGLAGWDLTVTLEELPDYGITVATAANGSVAASVGGTDATTAKESQTVTLTATPAEGYLLADLSVTCGGEAVELDWDVWTNSATFTMPDGDVTVTPTFTTKSGLFAIIPKTGTRTVTFPEGVTSFKVYDDGGPDGDYSPNCDGWLEINLPDGYHFHLSGSVTTDGTSNDRLSIYEGDRDHERQRVRSYNAGVAQSFTYDFGAAILLRFLSNDANQYAGVDLTVTLVGTEHTVTVNNADNVGGSVVTASVGGEPVTSVTAGQTVTLTASPAEGYVLGALSVRDAYGRAVYMYGDMLWYTGKNTVSFYMPASDVTVIPVFTNVMTAEGGLTANLPTYSDVYGVIPSGVTSFKVYDNGGADCNYSDGYAGELHLTAPEGCALQLSGTITTQSGSDYLDGYESDGYMLLNHVSSTSDGVETAIPTVVSTEGVITLAFYSNASVNYAGLDLTVTVISPGTYYGIDVSNADTSKGTMTASTTSAQLGTTVTLTASPSEGYVLSDLSVTCGGAAVKTDWNVWTNSATFKMPNGPVTVTPTFTNDLTSLAVNLPVTNNKFVTIPEGVTSFKIYDDGGPDGNYTAYCRGSLNMTAPEGSLLRFTGSIAGPEDKFILNFADNRFTASKNDIAVTSTGNKPYISLTARDNSGAGLDLTATVLYAVNVATGIANGTVTTDKANAAAGETVTLTVTPDDDYTIGSVSINGEPLEAVGGVCSFTMPARTVTVTATFRKRKDIATCEIRGTLEAYDDGYGPYNQLAANVEVWDGDTQLTPDTDYSIELDPNVDIYSYEVGKQYQATVTGMGNWGGTKTFTFTFVALHHTVVFVANGGSGTMDSDVVANNGGYAGLYYLPECTFTAPDGKVFDHWVVDYAGIEENPIKQPGDYFTAPYIFDVSDVQTITVTAYWRDALILLDDDSNQPVGSKNADIIAANNGTTDLTVQLQGRTLYKDGSWNTLCLPFDVTIADSPLAGDGVDVRTLSSTAFTGGKLTLNFTDKDAVTTLEAGKPYIIRWASKESPAENLVNPVFNGVTVSTATANVETDCVDFIGILSPTVLYEDGAEKTNLYMGSANKLYYPTVEGFKLNACRGYFKLKGVVVNGNENAVRSFDINFGDDATGIVEMRDEKGEMRNGYGYEDGGWYTVDGRRLDGKPAQKGLYIHGGRKVVIK